jgi:hypothetical protein
MESPSDTNMEATEPTVKRGGKRETPFSKLNGKEKVSDEDLLWLFADYNEAIGCRECCVNRLSSNPKYLQCNCGELFGSCQEFCMAVAEFQLYFGRESKLQQQKIVIEWMRVAHHLLQPGNTNKGRKYSIPFLAPKNCDQSVYEDLRTTGVCASTLMDILGVGKRWWMRCNIHANNNTLPQHTLKGQPTNLKRKWNELFEDSLVEHFELLREDTGPIATRFVRERTGEITTRDDDDKSEYLAPNWSKRRCYAKYCRTKGVEVSTTNRGTIIKKPLAGLGEEGAAMQRVPSWGAYLSFWTKRYANLKVSRPAEDICQYCYVFHNLHKYKVRPPMADDTSPPPPPPSSLPSGVQQQQGRDTSPPTPLASEDTTTVGGDGEEDHDPYPPPEEEVVGVDQETLRSEEAVLAAAKHVKMARAQRLLVNLKVQKAREDLHADHSQRTYTYICDYGQNMELPFFGGSQPGDTYYFTPLGIYNFGFVDVADPRGDHLYCHIYKEGDGKKGGNNVASLIMKSLQKMNVLQDNNKGKELNIVFDNCPGQNKNHHVLWLVPYLVEMGYFECVNFIFLVVGHTKNAADRRFNNLKMIYRRSNVTSFEKLIMTCSKSPHVSVWPVEDGDFRDYHTMFDMAYNAISGLLKHHIFTCRVDEATGSAYNKENTLKVETRESYLDEHEVTFHNMLKKNFFDYDWFGISFDDAIHDRKQWFVGLFPPDNLPFQGIPEYKQVTLYNSYRKYIPIEDRDSMCPRPSDEVLNSQKADKKRRAHVKKEAKQEAKLEATRKVKNAAL